MTGTKICGCLLNPLGHTAAEHPGRPLSRREITDIAKQLVLSDGPSNILEFGSEITVEKYGYREKYGQANCCLIDAEAINQAKRVYTFLGYVPR